MQSNDLIGLSFMVPCDYIKHFSLIFENINVEKYMWQVADCEIYRGDNIAPLFETNFETHCYDGKTFATIINDVTYHLIHSRVFAIPQGMAGNIENILSYEDYYISDFEIALLCADCSVDFYAKNKDIIFSVMEACKRNLSCVPDILTRENDTRTSFLI